MNIELPVKDLIEYLPHRSPMVWVDRVQSVGKDYKGLGGVCFIKLDENALYTSNKKQLRGSSAIEFTAQGFGYLKAAYQVVHEINDPPKKTYLTGVRSCNADFSSIDLKKVKELEIRISVLRELLPITYVRGEVLVPGSSDILGVAEIQVYVD